MLDLKVKQSPDPLLSGSLESELQAAIPILDLLPIATCICDADGRIVQYNRRAVELWGSPFGAFYFLVSAVWLTVKLARGQSAGQAV